MFPMVIETQISDVETVDIANEHVSKSTSEPHEQKVDATNVGKH